ncbi:YIP1 family protein [Methanosarcina sp. T3]|uniref:YIP1 family protein n=1 Tax=Methanosarcina sp. T3 TaxID=3439062 RepID=UPI003F82948F
MNFFSTANEIVNTPSEFFKKVPGEKGYYDPVIFACICALFPQLISGTIVSPILAFLIAFLFSFIIRLFIDSAVLHGLFRLVGGVATYESTFQILAYSYTAQFFTSLPIAVAQAGLVPDLSPILILYGIYLLTIGGQFVHKLSAGKAAIVAILCLFWYVVTSFILYLLVEPYM